MSIWHPEPGDEYYDDPRELEDKQTWTQMLTNAALNLGIVLCLFVIVALVCMGAGYVYGS